MSSTSIRQLTIQDFELVYRWENREELWKISDESGPYSREQIETFMQRCLVEPFGEIRRWIIETTAREPLGIIDLFDINWSVKSAGMGIMITEEKDRRKGHAHRALTQVLRILEQENWRVVRALIHEENIASRNLFSRHQFKEGGRVLYRGKPAIQYVCSLSEWNP
ncbi:MAG: GNAT family N-acetyltransferase [Flavobacteriales bacterium]|jgi:diamine N-acetyltransferase